MTECLLPLWCELQQSCITTHELLPKEAKQMLAVLVDSIDVVEFVHSSCISFKSKVISKDRAVLAFHQKIWRNIDA